MACGSGCCGPPKPPPAQELTTGGASDASSCCDSTRSSLTNAAQDENHNSLEDEHNNETSSYYKSNKAGSIQEQEDDCCGPSKAKLVKDNCCASKIPEAPCKKKCCDAEEKTESAAQDTCCDTTKADIVEDDCCSPTQAETSCKKGCCSTPTPAKISSQSVPICCEGKPSPCCDSTCIDRLALRDCESGKPTTSSDSSPTTKCNRGRDGRPCSGHSRSARENYQVKLDALGCICRALLALGQESCCAPPKEQSSVERTRSVKRRSGSLSSSDFCCATGVSKGASAATPRPRSKKGCQPAGVKAQDNDCVDDCCAASSTTSVADTCADACCSEKKPNTAIEKVKEVPVDVIQVVDLEKGLQGKEHVILSISGMTCTGCETKLKRTLGTLNSVKNLKTSLVLSRAEFDIDTSTSSATEVMKHLERTTEFKCERVTNQGASLDLICDGDPAIFVNGLWPEGVIEIRPGGKNVIHVDFDAKIIGARDLAERGWKNPMQLAPPRADPTLDAGSKHVRHVGYMTFLSAALTIPVLVLAWAPLPKREVAFGSASLALATIVQLVVAGPFYPKALKALIFSRVIEMDLLIVLSTSAAYIFSVVSFGYLVSGHPLSTGEFFETSTLLVTLIMVGRYVAALARQKAVESISIRSLQTPTAIIVGDTGSEMEIDARLLQYGDVFKVLPDCRIPTDGTAISGSSEINESMITGESRPVEKYVGSSIIAGSINGSGILHVRLTRLPGDNTISTIAGMVDEAKLSKPKIQDIADRVASYFVPVVVTLTIITFITWVAVGVAVRKQSGSEATIQAITYAITVLIVSCPCAIGLAVPMVIVIASGIAADRGVIFKSAESIEVACKTTDVVFDKTGTLTKGELSVVKEEHFSDAQSSGTKSLLLGLVSGNKHPVSTAVAEHLKTNGTSASTVIDPKNLTGKGVEGTTSNGHILRAGNSRWLNLSSHPAVQSFQSQGYTAFCFTVNNTLTAVYGLEDSLRSDALSTISKLHQSGISTHILSGDDDGAVQAVASQLSIPSQNVRSRCTPGDKQAYIKSLLSPPSNKSKKPVIIFCGDGTNDAVALAQATIGIHISSTSGTDVAQSAADVVLMRPNLTGILAAISVSKKSIRRIKFNFAWSFVYNLFAILLGAGAFVNARIPPEYAGLGELVSVLPVIAAAVLMRWTKV